MVDFSRPLFPMGQIVGTPPALDALDKAGVSAKVYLDRHVCGDWGEVSKADAKQNNQGIKEDRLMSVYTLSTGVQIWIITEWDRSVTTILLPEDY